MVTRWSAFSAGHSMIKNLVKHGNSRAVVIDGPILDLLKIDPESQLELTTDGKSILISAATGDDARTKVRQARASVNAKHSKAFRKLAEQQVLGNHCFRSAG